MAKEITIEFYYVYIIFLIYSYKLYYLGYFIRIILDLY